MIRITKQQRIAMEKVGLLAQKRYVKGEGWVDSNFVIVNRQSSGARKHTYVTETPEILMYLQKYDGFNLQLIRPNQLKTLKSKGLITDDLIQKPGEYKPGAIVFIDNSGQARMKKVTSLMIELGIWKSRDSKKEEKE